jgi:hypothetical protein
LESLMEAILAFTADDTAHVFDCREFLETL